MQNGHLYLDLCLAVAAGIIDSHVGLAGCGVTKPGELMLIIGTSSVLLTLSKKPYSKNGIVGAFRGGIIPEYYALESGLGSVGDQLEWYIKNCVPYKYIREAEVRMADMTPLKRQQYI